MEFFQREFFKLTTKVKPLASVLHLITDSYFINRIFLVKRKITLKFPLKR